LCWRVKKVLAKLDSCANISCGKEGKEMMVMEMVVLAAAAVMVMVIAVAMYDPEPVPFMDGHF
jgi:hypothetical protein